MYLKSKKTQLILHAMAIPAVVMIIIFRYIPMIGITIAFQNFTPIKGFLGGNQTWVGLDNFKYVLSLPNIGNVIANTLSISAMKMVGGLVVPIFFSLMLNEINNMKFKRSVQTMIYFPHFISWVILGGIFVDLLSSDGLVNEFLSIFQAGPIFFLGKPKLFPFVILVTYIWKMFGYGTIVYLATISGIDPMLYEAAEIDGAGRFKKMWHITLPGMRHIIVLLGVLNLGNILNAGFDQIFNMYNVIVYETGDVISTFVYRLGLENAKYSLASAIGLFKSIVSLFLISGSYYFAYKTVNYRIF